MDPNVIFPALVTGLITGLIALGGVVYTQHQAGTRLAEEREWQRELWARDHRRKTHLAFLAEQRRLSHWMAMYMRVGLEGVEEPKQDWAELLGRNLIEVQIFGSQAASVSAQQLYQATLSLDSGTVGAEIEANQAFEKFRQVVQKDLGLDATELPRWDTEDTSED